MSEQVKKGIAAIIKKGLDELAAKDAAFASKYQTKKLDDCVSVIFLAFYELAKAEAKGGCTRVGGGGEDELLVSAAVHWYDEDDANVQSVMDILKGGTQIVKLDDPKKESKPKPKPTPTGTTAEPAPKPKPAPKPVPTMGISKPTPKPVPKPTPKPVPVKEDDDMIIPDLFG